MARPRLSALISKLVFREALTSEEKALFRGDIGAETAGAAATAQAAAATDATTKADAAKARSNHTGTQAMSTVTGLADALVAASNVPILTRTTAEGPPTAGVGILSVGGTLATDGYPVTFEAMPYGGLLDGKNSWVSVSGYSTARWRSDIAKWQISNTTSDPWVATSPEAVATPDLVTTWTRIGGSMTGTPIVTLASDSGATGQLGQLCRTGDASPYRWDIFDGTGWARLDPEGGIDDYLEMYSLVSGTTIACDFTGKHNAKLTLAHNATLSLPVGLRDGEFASIAGKQDAVGGRTLALESGYVIMVGALASIGALTANKRFDIVIQRVDSSYRTKIIVEP